VHDAFSSHQRNLPGFFAFFSSFSWPLMKLFYRHDRKRMTRLLTGLISHPPTLRPVSAQCIKQSSGRMLAFDTTPEQRQSVCVPWEGQVAAPYRSSCTLCKQAVVFVYERRYYPASIPQGRIPGIANSRVSARIDRHYGIHGSVTSMMSTLQEHSTVRCIYWSSIQHLFSLSRPLSTSGVYPCLYHER